MTLLSAHVMVRRTGDSMVLLDTESGQYYELNETAAGMVEAMLEGDATDRICDRLAETFEVDPEVVRADLGELLKDLDQHGLLA